MEHLSRNEAQDDSIPLLRAPTSSPAATSCSRRAIFCISGLLTFVVLGTVIADRPISPEQQALQKLFEPEVRGLEETSNRWQAGYIEFQRALDALASSLESNEQKLLLSQKAIFQLQHLHEIAMEDAKNRAQLLRNLRAKLNEVTGKLSSDSTATTNNINSATQIDNSEEFNNDAADKNDDQKLNKDEFAQPQPRPQPPPPPPQQYHNQIQQQQDQHQGSQIPRIIHMTWMTKDISVLDQEIKDAINSWTQKNPGWSLTIWDDCDIVRFIDGKYPQFKNRYLQLSRIEKADFFRYLVLFDIGGVYSDMDTVCLQPIEAWDATNSSRLIVGLEGNFPDKEFAKMIGAPRVIQFCQWTIAAAPNHKILREIVSRIIVEDDNTHYNDGNNEVMETTGPGLWTDVIAWYLKFYDKEPKDVVQGAIVGDVKLLDIQGFGNTQSHSDSQRWDNPHTRARAYVHHLFLGSWRKHQNNNANQSC